MAAGGLAVQCALANGPSLAAPHDSLSLPTPRVAPRRLWDMAVKRNGLTTSCLLLGGVLVADALLFPTSARQQRRQQQHAPQQAATAAALQLQQQQMQQQQAAEPRAQHHYQAPQPLPRAPAHQVGATVQAVLADTAGCEFLLPSLCGLQLTFRRDAQQRRLTCQPVSAGAPVLRCSAETDCSCGAPGPLAPHPAPCSPRHGSRRHELYNRHAPAPALPPWHPQA